jgi:signal transduction histidine kinase
LTSNSPRLIARYTHAGGRPLLDVQALVEFTAPPDEDTNAIEVPADRRRHVLLLFKEAITNVPRHAQAQNVLLRVSIGHGQLWLEIDDDGRGFAPSAEHSGHGLRNMSYRADELLGILTVESEPQKSTRVSLRAPLSSELHHYAVPQIRRAA